MRTKATVSVTIDAELIKGLRQQAKDENRTLSNMIEFLLMKIKKK